MWSLCRYTTSDWTSSASSSLSPPSTACVLPKKIRGKTPRRYKTSSSKEPSSPIPNEISPDSFAAISSISLKMSPKLIIETLNLLECYEVLCQYNTRGQTTLPPIALPSTPPNVFQEVPLAWRLSLNELPPIDFESVRKKVKSASLLDHGFRAKALLEEDLLIVAGLHPIEDTYTGPESCYFHLPIHKFLPENVPSNPFSSSNTRSISATPLDIQSSGRSYSSAYLGYAPPEPPVIEVVTSPEDDTTLAPPSSPLSASLVPPPEIGSSSQKRPHVEEDPLEEASPGGNFAQIPAFPSPMMTP
ncbi:hypothetical protein Salat_1153900 [Sesamum alatum]|uniref:Uncharacterized protein n=1 Tax=Sesamum alatum TaxID=300844 RepID=A0AAE2CND9_9LAMI|nr:hypothetical protein Salat_1153900 [Sesamum alatum]